VLAWEGGSATPSGCVLPFSGLVELTQSVGGCCTVDVSPSQVGGGADLPALLANYANQGPVTICLEPGTYSLSAPLVLGPEFNGITLQSCSEGAVLESVTAPGPEFTLGLIVAQGMTSVTIRGVQLSVPLVGFSPPSGSFANQPATDNIQLLEAYSDGLQVGIGITVSDVTGLTVEDCTFSFPDPGTANAFCAGIYATGVMDGVQVTGCTFESASAPDTLPFYDLTVGNPTEPPYQPTFGYLQVPVATAADTAAGTTPLLHDAVIERCLFQGVSVAVLAVTQLGTVRVDQDTIRDAHGGCWLVSVSSQAGVTSLWQLEGGQPNVVEFLSLIGVAAVADRVFVFATAIGQVLPATVPVGGTAIALGNVVAADAGQLSLVRQQFSALRAQGAASVAASRAAPSSAGGETSTAVASPADTVVNTGGGETGLSDLPPDLTGIFQEPQPLIPPSDPGTSVTLRVDVSDCQVDAVLADSYSGAGLIVLDLTGGDMASALVHGSRIRSRFPLGEAAIAGLLAEACITGNIIANEVPQPLDDDGPFSQSFGLYTDGAFGALPVAITGNVFIDPAILPARPAAINSTIPWTALNTVIDYITLPVVTAISPQNGPAAGGTTVTIAGYGFTGMTGVQFGSAAVASPTLNSDDEITAVSPAGSAGQTVDVTVINPVGTSATSVNDEFSYYVILSAEGGGGTLGESGAARVGQDLAEPEPEPADAAAAAAEPEPAATAAAPAEPEPAATAPAPAEPQPEPAETASASAEPESESPSAAGQRDSTGDSSTAATSRMRTVQKPAPLRLVVTSGADTGRSFDLRPGANVIGREEGSDIQLDDDTVSHNHAVIRVRGGTASIEDLRSTNGTQVNGATIEGRTTLAPGDEIGVGDARMVLEAPEKTTPAES
jgi:hypothetical protein